MNPGPRKESRARSGVSTRFRSHEAGGTTVSRPARSSGQRGSAQPVAGQLQRGGPLPAEASRTFSAVKSHSDVILLTVWFRSHNKESVY